MIKCPFCHFDNEEGSLFCEQCKSDLGGVESVAALHAEPIAAEIVEAVSIVHFPDEAPVGEPLVSEHMSADAIPVAGVITAATAEVVSTIGAGVEGLSAETHPQVPVAEIVSEHSMAPGSHQVVSDSSAGAPSFPSGSTAPAAANESAAPKGIPATAQLRLLVLRGLKRNAEYPLYEGHNFIGRADEKPVDIDLEDQEPPDRMWSSRQHALITLEIDNVANIGCLTIEDLNSSNGTFVNRSRIYPGQKCSLNVNDVIQIGTVQMKVVSD